MSVNEETQLEQQDSLDLNDELFSFFEDGGTLKMLKDVPDDAIEQMYSVAFNLYETGKVEDAHKVFQVLCMLDHYQTRFYMGLAACRQEMGDLEQAIEAYSYAAILDIKDPRAPFHSAECHLKLGNLVEAESGFYSAKELAAVIPAQAELAQRADNLLEAVKQKRS